MLQKVWKFPTGSAIPEGATFLGIATETRETVVKQPLDDQGVRRETKIVENVLVWHYFLVDARLEVGQTSVEEAF